MADRKIILQPRGGLQASGAPVSVAVLVVLEWNEVLEIVRTGAVPTPIVDDLMVEFLAAGATHG